MSKKKQKKHRSYLANLYRKRAIEVGQTAVTTEAMPASAVISSEEEGLAKLMRHDIIRTVTISVILILILSAIYAIRNTDLINSAINQLAVYTGF